MNKESERCCTFLAEMMEKYGLQVMRDIVVEIQFDPEMEQIMQTIDVQHIEHWFGQNVETWLFNPVSKIISTYVMANPKNIENKLAIDRFTDIKKKTFLKSFHDAVYIYEEEKEDGRIRKGLKFKFPVFFNG